jgi:hypothetical protein
MIHWLAQEEFKSEGRFLSALLFKNTVLNTTNDPELIDAWINLGKNLKDDLKYGALLGLGSDDT